MIAIASLLFDPKAEVYFTIGKCNHNAARFVFESKGREMNGEKGSSRESMPSKCLKLALFTANVMGLFPAIYFIADSYSPKVILLFQHFIEQGAEFFYIQVFQILPANVLGSFCRGVTFFLFAGIFH